MLGRGVKRKWSCLAELEAEVLSDAVKHDGEEDGEDEASKSCLSHLQQRQLVLGLCLEKLQHYQAGVELSLRRSVLLINTLRQIQEEMRCDGMGTCTPNVLCAVGPHSCLLREEVGEDMPVTCPGCVSPEFPSQETDTPLDQKSLPPVISNTSGDAGNATGYLGDLALDDIFEDIDTSMYETSDLPSAWSAGSLWPISVSLWPDEDMKLRTSSHSTAGGLQSCLLDLNELDHIMEILVKS